MSETRSERRARKKEKKERKREKKVLPPLTPLLLPAPGADTSHRLISVSQEKKKAASTIGEWGKYGLIDDNE